MTYSKLLNLSCGPGRIFFDGEKERESCRNDDVERSPKVAIPFPSFPQPDQSTVPSTAPRVPSVHSTSSTTTNPCVSFPEPDYADSSSIPTRAPTAACRGPSPSFPEPDYSHLPTMRTPTFQVNHRRDPTLPRPDYSNVRSTTRQRNASLPPTHGSLSDRSSHGVPSAWPPQAWTEPMGSHAPPSESGSRDRGFGVEFHRDLRGMARWVKRKLLGRDHSHHVGTTSNDHKQRPVPKAPPQEAQYMAVARYTGQVLFPMPEVNAHVRVRAFPTPDWLAAERDGSHAYAAWNG